MKMRDVSFKVYALIIGFALLQVLAPVQVLGAESNAPSVPTTLFRSEGWTTTSSKPLLRGVTNNDTSVAVYIDDILNGYAQVKNAKSGTASFAYEPFLPLGSGYHSVKVRAEKADGQRSEVSSKVKFLVEDPYPAPTLFAPVVNKKASSTKPFIVGLVKNNSLVKVFIDGRLDGQFWVKKASGDIVDFSYKPFLPLDPKKDHLVYAIASDADGKESMFSNVEGFRVRAPKKVVSTAAAGSSSEVVTDAATTDESTDTVGGTETTEETSTAPTTENTQPSTDNATPSDTDANQSTVEQNANTNKETTGEEVKGEETNNETENSGEEQNTNDNKEESAATTTDDATPNDDQKQDRSWIIWVIIIILILIILFRGRGDIQRRMQGGSSTGNGSDTAKKALDKINPSTGAGTTASKSSSGEKKDESSSPPPPPASSSY